MDKLISKNEYITHDVFVSSMKNIDRSIGNLKTTFEKAISETRDQIEESISKLTGIVMRIEQRENMYSDMYQMNKTDLTKLTNRVNRLEKKTGETPPPDLLIMGL
jgi:BMFP domain-containing protein YqiC